MQADKARVRCWECRYCDKELVLIEGKWHGTASGFCLAEHSAVNGPDKFYQKVYQQTRVICPEYEPKT